MPGPAAFLLATATNFVLLKYNCKQFAKIPCRRLVLTTGYSLYEQQQHAECKCHAFVTSYHKNGGSTNQQKAIIHKFLISIAERGTLLKYHLHAKVFAHYTLILNIWKFTNTYINAHTHILVANLVL